MNREFVHSPESRVDLATFERSSIKRQVAELAIAHTFMSATGSEAYVITATVPDAPEEERPQRPIYFHGGYGADNTKYIRYLAEQHGRSAFTVVYGSKRQRDQIYWQEEPMTNEWQLVPRSYVKQQLPYLAGATVAKGQVDMADDIFTAMDCLDMEKVDAIGQSVGALRTTIAAYEQPERIGNIVLPYPAGIAKPNRREMLPNGVKYARAWKQQRDQNSNLWQPFLDEHTTCFQKSPTNVGADGENVLLSYHTPLIHAMRQGDKAPGVAVITGEHDYIFPTSRMLRSLQGSEDIDYLYVTPGQHAIGDRKQIMDQTMQLLDMTEARTNAPEDFEPLAKRILSHANVAPAYVEALREQAAML
jgi:pimeloyl-ACP methyl ester carboxylesterase